MAWLTAPECLSWLTLRAAERSTANTKNTFMLTRAYQWFDRNILELGRELRLSYLPPLMVYLAYGVSGLTAIVGTSSSRTT